MVTLEGPTIKNFSETTGDWIKMWIFYKMEYYSAIKNEKLEAFTAKWMHTEAVL